MASLYQPPQTRQSKWFLILIVCRLAEQFMAHDPQRQSPVLAQVVEISEAHIASLPIHARRKLSRLAIQVVPGIPAQSVSRKSSLCLQTTVA